MVVVDLADPAVNVEVEVHCPPPYFVEVMVLVKVLVDLAFRLALFGLVTLGLFEFVDVQREVGAVSVIDAVEVDVVVDVVVI